jgi:hypothetical protein
MTNIDLQKDILWYCPSQWKSAVSKLQLANSSVFNQLNDLGSKLTRFRWLVTCDCIVFPIMQACKRGLQNSKKCDLLLFWFLLSFAFLLLISITNAQGNPAKLSTNSRRILHPGVFIHSKITNEGRQGSVTHVLVKASCWIWDQDCNRFWLWQASRKYPLKNTYFHTDERIPDQTKMPEHFSVKGPLRRRDLISGIIWACLPGDWRK